MSGNDGENRALGPGLYIVATPIGNLGDITLRALETLGAADLIACEDSRVTAKLLAAHAINTPMTSYHEHNAGRARPKLIRRLMDGARVALVSDAGTPLISDPGYKLVAACRDNAIPVTVLPGASAPLSALVLSGLPSDRFLFAGFLPTKSKARHDQLKALAEVDATLVMFESGRRLAAMLGDALDVLGPRQAAICRELTKLYEEVVPGDLAALAQRYANDAPPKGEIVVVIGPPLADTKNAVSDDDLDSQLEAALSHDSLRDAVAAVAQATGLPRRRVYGRALKICDTTK